MKDVILFIGTGREKEIYFKKAVEDYLILLLTNKEVGWEREYITDYRIIDSFDETSAISAVTELQQNYDITAAIIISEPYVKIAGAIFEEFDLPGISRQTALNCRDKRIMKEAFLQHGVPTARGVSVNSKTEFMDFGLKMETPFIVKPIDSWASYAVYKVTDNSADKLESIYQMITNFTSGIHNSIELLIEEYLEADEELSVESLIYHGEILPLAIHKKPTPLNGPFFVEKDMVYDNNLDPAEEKQIFEINCKAIKALGIENGASHLEMRRTPQGYKVLEVGCRIGGGAIPQNIESALGIDMIKEYMKIAFGIRPHVERRWNRSAGFSSIFCQQEGKIVGIRGLAEVESWPGVEWVKFDTGIGDYNLLPPKSYKLSLGTYAVVGDSVQEVLQLMQKVDQTIKIEVE